MSEMAQPTDTTKTTPDGFTVVTQHHYAFKNGHNAWDGYKWVKSYKVYSPSGALYQPHTISGFMPKARAFEPVIAAVKAAGTLDRAGLVALLQQHDYFHMEHGKDHEKTLWRGALSVSRGETAKPPKTESLRAKTAELRNVVEATAPKAAARLDWTFNKGTYTASAEHGEYRRVVHQRGTSLEYRKKGSKKFVTLGQDPDDTEFGKMTANAHHASQLRR